MVQVAEVRALVQVLEQAQEQVLGLAREQARVLGLAASQLEYLGRQLSLQGHQLPQAEQGQE